MKLNIERQDIKDWLQTLDSASRQDRYKRLWKRVYKMSAVPSRRRKSVNIYKINRYTREGDNVIVPGKVLSEGSMAHKVNICALEFSGKALETLKASNCKVSKLSDMVKADKIKIIV